MYYLYGGKDHKRQIGEELSELGEVEKLDAWG